MHHSWLRLNVAILGLAALLVLPAAGGAQNLDTLGAGVAGESTAARLGGVPTGPTPRLPNGHIDFSGVWDHAYVPDMSLSNNRTPALQKGAGELPYTPVGLENITKYDPERDGDYTGICRPFGLMRSVNAPYPFQIMQSDKYVAFLFEQNSWFHVVPFKQRTFTMSNGDLLEYSCEENNKSLWEGRIKLWLPPGTSQPRK